MADALPDYTELVEQAKLALRLTGDAFDDEVDMLVGAAVTDMLRVGVSADYVSALGPLVRQAACLYCKASFGFDNDEAARFQASYRQTVTDMLNSSANSAASL